MNEGSKTMQIVASGPDYKENDLLRVVIRNYTAKYYDNDFCPPVIPHRDTSKGKYKGVGTTLYAKLEEYLKQNYPCFKRFFVNAINSGSWDFHCKIGFDDKVGNYDCYDWTHYLYKDIYPKLIIR